MRVKAKCIRDSKLRGFSVILVLACVMYAALNFPNSQQVSPATFANMGIDIIGTETPNFVDDRPANFRRDGVGRSSKDQTGHAVTSYQTSGPCGNFSRKNYSFMDVVIVNMVLTCSTRDVVERLVSLYSFRKIFFITKHMEFCTVVAAWSHTVICLHEDDVIPGVSYEKLVSKSKTIQQFQGISNRVGWYYAMFLKVGVGHYLDGLSDYFLVWDSDNVPVVPIDFFTKDFRMKYCANPMGVKPNGYVSGYGKFHALTTGLQLLRPNHTGSNMPDPLSPQFNFVCGYIIGYRPYVTELIHHMEQFVRNTQADLPLDAVHYPWNILHIANTMIKENVFWADYDTYPSWVANKHPDRFAADFTVTYTRNPGVLISGLKGKYVGSRFRCCLSHTRICQLARISKRHDHFHSFLIWEEHKMRYRGDNQCTDALPLDVEAAISTTGFMNNHYPKSKVDTKELLQKLNNNNKVISH